MATRAKRRRYVVGSSCGRGPCDGCGLIAELHQVGEEAQFANLNAEWWSRIRVLDLCLPCSYDAQFASTELVLAPRKAA